MYKCRLALDTLWYKIERSPRFVFIMKIWLTWFSFRMKYSIKHRCDLCVKWYNHCASKWQISKPFYNSQNTQFFFHQAPRRSWQNINFRFFTENVIKVMRNKTLNQNSDMTSLGQISNILNFLLRLCFDFDSVRFYQ